MIRDIERVIANELMPDEVMLWAGQPNPAKLFTKADIYLVPLTILWCGVALGILSTGLPGLVIGVPAGAVALYCLVGRFFTKAFRKKRTVCAVTNRRVMQIMLNASGEKKIVSLDIKTVLNESVVLHNDGCGSLCFGDIPSFSQAYANTGMDFMPSHQINDALAFFDIHNALRVLQIYKGAKYGPMM